MKFSFNPDNVALLVVDMQRLFTEPSSPFQNDAAAMIIPINQLVEKARQVGIPIIHSAYEFATEKEIGLRNDWPQIQQGYFNADSPWTDWDARLTKADGDYSLTRSRPGAFWGGELDALLKKLGKDQIILCGLSINYAISFTAQEAFSRDIPVFLVSDLSNLAPFEQQENKEVFLQALNIWACEVTNSTAIISELKAPSKLTRVAA